ncbi:MAG: 1-acyl-sn-glycerol-3-phosphate acyltransferase [Burkholderiaceae bacterium]|jgi:1-acyl-sn-glycerol-3-phosphate acyltransferase|nr:1-acyl-sn-glycerol-3-phosphate acyltransferase [Burkholderiaceae bacterium]
MNLLRSLLHMLWMSVTIIPMALLMMLLAPFASSRFLYGIGVSWLRLAVGGGRVLLGISNRVQGLENLPPEEDGPAVLLVKHQSTWDTFVMPLFVRRQLAYVLKRELLRIPFFGWALARVDMIHIDRNRRAEAFSKLVHQGARMVRQGRWVIIFPEGTRVPRGQRGVYRIGGARLAVECGAPVIPVAITSARCWPPKAFIKCPGVVDISIGKPIASVDRKPNELMREAENWIEAEMLRLDPDAYPGGQAALDGLHAPESDT